MLKYIESALKESSQALANFQANAVSLKAIEQAALTIISSLRNQGFVYSCGNGGSMCDAMHFAEELSGRFRKDRAALPAIAISDPAHLTCVANDFGFAEVFSRYVQSHCRAGDTLLAISTSGKSPNIVAAAKAAKNKKVRVIGLTGKPNSELSPYCDVEICTSGGQFSDRVQEMHIKVLHILIELIERELFPENYR